MITLRFYCIRYYEPSWHGLLCGKWSITGAYWNWLGWLNSCKTINGQNRILIKFCPNWITSYIGRSSIAWLSRWMFEEKSTVWSLKVYFNGIYKSWKWENFFLNLNLKEFNYYYIIIIICEKKTSILYYVNNMSLRMFSKVYILQSMFNIFHLPFSLHWGSILSTLTKKIS